MALVFRKRLVRQGLHFTLVMIPMLIMAVLFFLAMLLGGTLPVGIAVLIGLTMLLIAAFNSVLHAASSRENASQILFRKNFAAAREYFQSQLATSNPELQDVWYPYLLAFGLGESVDRWFQSYGGTGVYTSHSTGSAGSFSGGGGSQPWTGGGGAFGGAGASASWAAVAGTMAAGVAAPSSSGSGGGGGGGSSSGGGGGGGW